MERYVARRSWSRGLAMVPLAVPTNLAQAEIARKGHIRRARKLLRLLPNPAYRRALRHGVAAAIEHSDVAFAHAFACVVDVGAHHGQFALLASQRFPTAEIFCIEPLPQARLRLERVLRGHPRLTVLPVAAADASGTMTLHVSRLSDSSSLREITPSCTAAFPGTEEASTQDVEAMRLDDIFADREIERPSLLKLDVQGAELDVLKGALELLTRVDEVFVECSFVEFYRGQALIDEVIGFLHDRGFALRGIYSVVRDARGSCLQADLLFGRRTVNDSG